MNTKPTMLLGLFALGLQAQMNTEVYLMDIIAEEGALTLGPAKNISNNEGYDNQPSFYNDNQVLFSATRNGQTDIAQYNVRDAVIEWRSNTKQGSEYSPLKIPGKREVSAIRLDTNGLQRLYRYDMASGVPQLLLKDQKVGYHLWYNDEVLVTTVLVENRMDLVVSNLKDHTHFTYQKNVGRSLHKIPNSNLVSFVSKEQNDYWEIKSLNPITGATETITKIPPVQEDMCWLLNGSILMARGNTLLQFNPEKDENWSIFHRFENKNLGAISRLQTNANASKLALVSEISPELVVQRQVDAFNTRDLEKFAACYSSNVVVKNFPGDTLYTGNTALKNNYQRFYDKNPDVKVEVLKRISIGNKVIDEEKVTIAGQEHRQAAIYEVNNGLISSMTFVLENHKNEDAVVIVDKQLEVYNARDIDGFVATYAETIETYDFPLKLRSKGREQLRQGYKGFFESTPDLNCTITQRIVLGNIVIDEEFLTIRGNNVNAVAIYEVKDGKIAKVTFVR